MSFESNQTANHVSRHLQGDSKKMRRHTVIKRNTNIGQFRITKIMIDQVGRLKERLRRDEETSFGRSKHRCKSPRFSVVSHKIREKVK